MDLALEGTCVPDVRLSQRHEFVEGAHRTDDYASGAGPHQQGAGSEILAYRQRPSGGAPELEAEGQRKLSKASVVQ